MRFFDRSISNCDGKQKMKYFKRCPNYKPKDTGTADGKNLCNDNAVGGAGEERFSEKRMGGQCMY